MSAKSNLSATRKSACNTGSRVAVAPVTVILGPAYRSADSAAAMHGLPGASKPKRKSKPAKSYVRSTAATASVSTPVDKPAKSSPAKKAAPSKSKKVAAKLAKVSAKTGKRVASKKPAPAKPKNTKAIAPKPPRKPVTEDRLHVSTIENPVAAMWELCQKMKNARRKDVIAEAQKHGIAFYTARTQYQLWLTASRNSK